MKAHGKIREICYFFIIHLFGEKLLKLNLFSGNFATPNFGTTAIPEEQKEFMNGIFEKVDKWLKNAKPDEKLMLDSCNPFQRRLIYRFVIKFVINN